MLLFVVQMLGDESRRMEYDSIDRKTSFNDATTSTGGLYFFAC